MIKLYNCLNCNSEFQSKKGCTTRQPKFCSKVCYAESLTLDIKCKLCGSQIQNKHSVKISNRVYCSVECQGKARRGKPLDDKWRLALSEGRLNSDKCRGQNLYNWKGGKETKLVRQKQSYYKRKRSLKKPMPIDYLNRMIILQNNKCFFCDTSLKEYKAIEHLTPVSKGGDNDFYNLVYSCQSCNSKKRQKTLEQYSIQTNQIHLLDKWETLMIAAL